VRTAPWLVLGYVYSRGMLRFRRRLGPTAFGLALFIVAYVSGQTPAPQAKSTSILEYIRSTWTVLTRSNANLGTAAVDPKFKPRPDGRWTVYIPRDEDQELVQEGLRREMPAAAFKSIAIESLPADLDALPSQGLLYLPHPYVVPGGRFNEMYGWDSYFMQVGLLRDGQTEMAKNLADNFLYEVKHYGQVLNANRTYYMTRSQPPFLTQMVLGVYQKTHDREWLKNALPSVTHYYDVWAKEPHLTPETGLARYFDLGDGPAPEVISSERDADGKTHYERIRDFFEANRITDYDVSQYYDRSTKQLTPLFYKGDRSMRESGFDPSNRFGAFNIDIIHYNPVCLNSLLFLMEQQIADIYTELGNANTAQEWRKKASLRGERVNRLMWDDTDGLYYDYNFGTKKVRKYPFLTTFYPLWAGFASKDQASRVMKNLDKFERAGGLQTSTYISGNQWDSPFGWAPLQLIAVEGMRKYGFEADAERISMKFLTMVQREFLRQGYIVEKYDVVKAGTEVSGEIRFGYSANQAGFGWTNAAFTSLYDELKPEDQHKLVSAGGRY